MIRLLTALVLFAAMTACDGNKKKIEALTQETNTIHDEAMKDMAEMNRTARAIKEFMMSATMTPEQSQVYADVLQAIGTAENNMMSWMSQYKEPEGQPAADAIKYLEAQKTLIQQNHEEIKKATADGKKLLGQ